MKVVQSYNNKSIKVVQSYNNTSFFNSKIENFSKI